MLNKIREFFLKGFLQRNIRHGLALISGLIFGFLTMLGYPDLAEKAKDLLTDKEMPAMIVAVIIYLLAFVKSVIYERRNR